MMTWTSHELRKIDQAEELDISTARHDGTLRNPVTIWVVRHCDDIYVRSVNGRGASWFRGGQDRHEAHIQTDGVERDVQLVETDEADDEIDEAYRTKYRRYAAGIVDSIITPKARASTLKLVPRPVGPTGHTDSAKPTAKG
jgi:hypothetical protein